MNLSSPARDTIPKKPSMKDSCHEFAADLDLLVAGVLPPGEERVVEAHLAGCAACRERYEMTRKLCADLSSAGNTTGSTDADAWPLRNRVRRVLQGTPPREGVRWLPAAAMAGVLALVALVVGNTGPQPPVASPVPVSSASPVVDDPPLTLLACERAAARSDAVLDQVLSRGTVRSNAAPGPAPLRAFPPTASLALETND